MQGTNQPITRSQNGRQGFLACTSSQHCHPELQHPNWVCIRVLCRKHPRVRACLCPTDQEVDKERTPYQPGGAPRTYSRHLLSLCPTQTTVTLWRLIHSVQSNFWVTDITLGNNSLIIPFLASPTGVATILVQKHVSTLEGLTSLREGDLPYQWAKYIIFILVAMTSHVVSHEP